MSENREEFTNKAKGVADVAAMGVGALSGKYGKEDLLGKIVGKESLAMRVARATDANGGIADRTGAAAELGGDSATGMSMALSGGLHKIGLGSVADAVTPDESKAGEMGTLLDKGSGWGDKFEAALGVSGNEKFGGAALNGLEHKVDDLVPDDMGAKLGKMLPGGSLGSAVNGLELGG